MKKKLFFLPLLILSNIVFGKCDDLFPARSSSYYLFSLNPGSCQKYRSEIIETINYGKSHDLKILLLCDIMSEREVSYFLQENLNIDTHGIEILSNPGLAQCLLTGGFDIYFKQPGSSPAHLFSRDFMKVHQEVQLIPQDSIYLNDVLVPINKWQQYYFIDDTTLVSFNPSLGNLSKFNLQTGTQILSFNNKSWALEIYAKLNVKSFNLKSSAELYDNLKVLGNDPLAILKVYEYEQGKYYALASALIPVGIDSSNGNLLTINQLCIIEFSESFHLSRLLFLDPEVPNDKGNPTKFLARLNSGDYISLDSDDSIPGCADEHNTCLSFNILTPENSYLILKNTVAFPVHVFFRTYKHEVFLHSLIPVYDNGITYGVYKFSPSIFDFSTLETNVVLCDTTFLLDSIPKSMSELDKLFRAYYINFCFLYDGYVLYGVRDRTVKSDSYKFCLNKLGDTCYACTDMQNDIFLNSWQFIQKDTLYVFKNNMLHRYSIQI